MNRMHIQDVYSRIKLKHIIKSMALNEMKNQETHSTDKHSTKCCMPIRSCDQRIMTLLYCLVSIHFYSASFSATNQKRFQCERPSEKRAVLRERKETLGSPVNKMDCIEGRSLFQSRGPMIAKA